MAAMSLSLRFRRRRRHHHREAGTITLGVANAIASSSGVDLGRIGGGATAGLILGTNNTIASLNSEAGDTTSVQLGSFLP